VREKNRHIAENTVIHKAAVAGKKKHINACKIRKILLPASTLKGLCHEITNFMKVLKIKSVFSVPAPLVLYYFAALLWRK
jgi:hypothetical protein